MERVPGTILLGCCDHRALFTPLGVVTLSGKKLNAHMGSFTFTPPVVVDFKGNIFKLIAPPSKKDFNLSLFSFLALVYGTAKPAGPGWTRVNKIQPRRGVRRTTACHRTGLCLFFTQPSLPPSLQKVLLDTPLLPRSESSRQLKHRRCSHWQSQ